MDITQFVSVWAPVRDGAGRHVGLIDDAVEVDFCVPKGFTEVVIADNEDCRFWVSGEHSASILRVGTVVEVSLYRNDLLLAEDVSAVSGGRVTVH